MKTLIVLVTYNGYAMTKDCLSVLSKLPRLQTMRVPMGRHKKSQSIFLRQKSTRFPRTKALGLQTTKHFAEVLKMKILTSSVF